jgi:FMN phosphatase YigB (HAD superfamily)
MLGPAFKAAAADRREIPDRSATPQALAPVNRPEFVYFDLGNVIFSFDRDRAFRQMAAVCGAAPEVIRKVVLEDGLQESLERGALDWPAFHAEFSRRTGTASDAETLALAASDMFALKVETLPVIAALERAGCPIGILSNTCGVHWGRLTAGGYAVLPGGFRELVLSYEVGCLKPEPSIYETAAGRAGVPPERIFFCDDIPAHVEAARRAGWDAEVFESAAGLADALVRRGFNLGL